MATFAPAGTGGIKPPKPPVDSLTGTGGIKPPKPPNDTYAGTPLAGTGGIKPAPAPPAVAQQPPTGRDLAGALHPSTPTDGPNPYAGTDLAAAVAQTQGVPATPAQPAQNPINSVFQEALINQLSTPPASSPSTGGNLANALGVPASSPSTGGNLANALGVPASSPSSATPTDDVFREALVDQLGRPAPGAANYNDTPDPNDPFAAMGGGVQLSNGDWVPKDHPMVAQAAPAATAAPVTAPTTAPVPTAEPTTAPVTAGVEPNPNAPPSAAGVDDELRKALLAQLTAGQQPVGSVENDPRAAAFRVAQKRNADRTRAQATESAAQGGMLGTGGFNGVNRAIDASRAESEAGYEAGLVGEQMDERRQELQFAMTMAGQMGDREAQANLQRELAKLDADIQREGLAVTTRGQDIDAKLQEMGFGVTTRGQDIQKYGINQSAEIDRADQILRRYGLDLNDKQTRQRLGFDYAALTEQANRQAMLAALGLGE
jgi:hypothetical protein